MSPPPQRSGGAVRSFLLNSLAGIAVALVLLLLVELGLRTFLPFPLTTTTTYQAFDDVTYFHKPNSTGYELSPYGEFSPVRLDYDQYGFRDTGHPVSGKGQAIALMGDSFVEARQVQPQETAAGVVATAMPEFDLLNAGCSSFTTTTSFLVMNHRLAGFPVTKYYYIFSFNDYADNFWYYGGYYKQKDIPSSAMPNPTYVPKYYHEYSQVFENWLGVNSAIYAYFKDMTKPPRTLEVWKEVVDSSRFNDSPRNVNKPTSEMDGLEREVLDFTHQGILAMADLARERNADFAVAIIPLPPQVNAEEWKVGKKIFGYAPDETIESRVYQERLIGFLDEHGIRYIDLLPLFQQRSTEGHRMFLDFDGHFTRYGNVAVAEAVLSDNR